MSDIKRIGDIVIPNPKVTISKGTIADYVPMEDISPNNRYTFAQQKRAYSGGSKFENGDVLFARITPCLQNRKIGQYTSKSSSPAYGSTEYFVFRAIPKISDASYVYYLLKSDLVVDTAINSMKGASGRQRAEIKPILDLEISIPEHTQQVEIGKILTAYDNLIENNNRRIAIIEEMAQRFYREWFVHFRFPGHESVKMVESEIGLIPEGWNTFSLFDAAYVQYGYAFKSNLFNEEKTLNPVVRIRDILGNETNTFSPETPNDKYIIENGDILIGMDGIFHMNQWSSGKAYLNQRVVRLRAKDISNFQLYYSLQPIIKNLQATISGTTVAHLSDADLKKIEILVADDNTQEKANNQFENLLNQKVFLLQKNTNLRKTRDLLLPHLIFGDIDIPGISIPTEED